MRTAARRAASAPRAHERRRGLRGSVDGVGHRADRGQLLGHREEGVRVAGRQRRGVRRVGGDEARIAARRQSGLRRCDGRRRRAGTHRLVGQQGRVPRLVVQVRRRGEQHVHRRRVVATRARRPAVGAQDVGTLRVGRLAPVERSGHAAVGREGGLGVARREAEPDLERARLHRGPERVLALEVHVGLREPAAGVAVAAPEEREDPQAVGGDPPGVAVVDLDRVAQGVPHVGLCVLPVLTGLDRRQRPGAERDRVVVVAERDRRPQAPGQRLTSLDRPT